MTDMSFFKEHIPVCKDYDYSRYRDEYCFKAFCVWRNGNLFLHEVYKKMKQNACKHDCKKGTA